MNSKINITIETIPAADLKGGVVSGQKFDFGKTFSDRMFVMSFTPDQGWQDMVIKKYGNFEISPAASVLHYGQEIFEGLKAYYRADGRIGLFRARDNFKRMNISAARLCMPQFDIDCVMQALKELLTLEKNWVPREEGASLYIRPTMIGIDPLIKLKPSDSFMFYIIMSPVGMYYVNGFAPVHIMVEEKYVRAVPGGLGYAKTGANYAASLLPGKEAAQRGFDQVLWLDGVERRYVEEVGSMNIFFRYKDRLVTSSLNGSILPGITRDSVVRMAQYWKIPVEETQLDINQLIRDAKTGAVIESFGSGTAAVISPVGKLHYRGEDIVINDNKVGELTLRLYTELTGIQYGRVADPFGWTDIVC